MQRLLRFVLMVAACVVWLSVGGTAAGQVRVPAGFPIEIECEAVAFGFVRPNEVKQFEIWFRNTSEETVTVRKAQPSCPCMVTQVVTKEVPAGGRGKVLVVIEGPDDELGPMDQKFVFVFVDGFREPAQIWVSGELTPGVRVTFDGAFIIGGREGTLVIESVEGKAFSVLGVGGEPAGSIEVTGVDGEARVRHEIGIELGGISAETVARWVLVETDFEGAELVDVRADVRGVWRQWRPVRRWRWHKKRERVDGVVVGKARVFSALVTGVEYTEGLELGLRSLTEGVHVDLVETRDPEKGGGVECVISMRVEDEGLLEGGVGYACVLELRYGKQRSGLDVFGTIER